MKKIIFIVWTLLVGCFTLHQVHATIYYVRTTGFTSNDGLSWAKATSIQKALAVAAAGDTILIAKGTYKPDTLGTNKNLSFTLKDRMVLLGGYADTGNPAIGSRNPTTNLTVLSGDLNNNDACVTMSSGGSVATYTDNSLHVVTIPAAATTGVYIQGFTISGGAATSAVPDNQGAGILVVNGARQVRIRDCIITCNYANSDGAGIAHQSGTNSRLWLQDCTVTQNRSNTGDGGGVMVKADSATITGSTISTNRGSSGGGLAAKIINAANCVYSLTNNTFESNISTLAGGAINIVNGANLGYIIDGNNFVANTALNGGAIGFSGTTTGVVTYIQSNKFVGNIASLQGGGAIFISNVSLDANGTAQSTILNNVFSGNQASANSGTNGNGGAIIIQGLTATQKAPVIANNTFSRNVANGNNAGVGGGALFVGINNSTVDFTVFNNIFWNNTNTGNRGNNLFVTIPMTSPSFKYAHSIINAAEATCTGGCQDTGVAALIGKDPKFYDDDGADNVVGTLDDDLRLQYDNTVAMPFLYNYAFDQGVYTYNGFTTLNVDYLGFDRTCLPEVGAYEYTHYWKGGTTDWNVGANWSNKCGNVVPTNKMNIFIGTNDQSTTNATGGITGTTTPTTPILDVTNHVGFSFYVNNNVLMQANTLITLQGNFRVGGNGVFNNSASAYAGKVLMKPTDCSYAQVISNGNQCNFNHLQIDNAANVTKTGNNVNVKTVVEMTNGNLDVNGGFTLLSTATGTAMVANDPAAGVSPTTRRITGTVTAQRHVTGHPTGFTGVGYHYFASPVAAAPISQFNSVMSVVVGGAYYWYNPAYTLANFPNFFFYQEGNNTDDGTNTSGFEGGQSMGGWRSFANTGVNMGIGTGYCVHIQQGLTPTFRGTLNNGTYTTAITKTGAAPFSGWNLVGNPYPSPLDWDLVSAANSGVLEATLYRRIPKGTLNIVTFSKYTAGLGLSEVGGGTVGGAFVADGTANVDKNIALGQGFFVVAKGNGNVTVNNTMRPTVATQTQPLFLRTEGNEKPMAIKLRFQNSQYYDEIAIHSKEGATVNFDGDGDARKGIPNGGQMPDMYMLTADKVQVAINGLPLENWQKGVALVVQPKTAGKYEIKLQTQQNMPAGTTLWIWDKELNTKQLLTEKQSYACNLEAKTYASRFEVWIDLPIDQKLNNTLTIYPNPVENAEQATLRFLSNNQATLKVSVYDLTGRLVKTQTVEKQRNAFETSFSTKELPAGVYVVEVNDGANSYTTKLVK